MKNKILIAGEEMKPLRLRDEIVFSKIDQNMSDLEISTQKLKALEEHYRLILENVIDRIFIIDTDLKIFGLFPSTAGVLGYMPQDFIGQPASELGYIFTPDSYQQAMEDIGSVLRGTSISARDYHFIAKDGSIKYGEISGSPMILEGKIIGMICIARDVTDRKLAEDNARESERRYRELVDFLPIPVYEMDLEANLTAANRAIFETFKGTEEDLKKGLNIFQFIPPEGVERSKKNIQRLLRGEDVESTEYTLNRLDGSAFTSMVISSVITSNGRPIGFRGAIIDITERKKAEDDLRRLNAFLDSIVENIPDMIFLKDAKRLRFVRINRAGEDLIGLSRDALLGKCDYDFFPKEQADFFTERDREVLNGKELKNIEEEPLQTRRKGDRILHTKKVPILNLKGEPEFLLGISEDITDRKKTENMLQQTLESLRKAVGVTIRVVAAAVEARDPYTSGHQKRVAALAYAIGQDMDLHHDQIEAVQLAASIHDIGKISIPAEILSKPTRLTEIEYALMKTHSEVGYEILKNVESSWRLAEIVYQHHERINGSGYPRKLKGDEIILEARIISVADVVEAMSTHRPYRPALGSDAALKEIENNRGILYDSKVVDACLKLFREKGYQLLKVD